MFNQLKTILARPAPFAHYTAMDLWADDHTSAQMLKYHLDGSVDVSSRKTAFIDRSADWIITNFGLQEGSRVADFGCGPGLYTSRFARSGAQVTGIDFSPRSIQYAKAQTESIDYVQANYLDFETDQRFDLITMIMCDFCALGPSQRQRLLENCHRLLKEDGALLFDVYTLEAFAAREETTTFAPQLLDGFWSPNEYFGFLSTFKYEAEKVVLDKYTLIEAERERVIYNWLQYFDRQSLQLELQRNFIVERFLANVAGDPVDTDTSEMAVIARKQR